MWILVSVLLPFLHHAAGCRASDSGVLEVQAVSGDAVLLPCSCTDLNKTPESSSWLTNSRTASVEHHYTDITRVYTLYRGRITRFNHTTPGNLSLLLSDLTIDDQGWYICWINNVSRFINLTVGEKSSPLIPESSTRHPYILTCVLIIITGGAAVTYWTYKTHKNKMNSSNGHTSQEQGQDEYCSMQPIPIPQNKHPEEVYASIDKQPDDQEYVSMKTRHAFTQPDVKQ